jgi:hypothetical protein
MSSKETAIKSAELEQTHGLVPTLRFPEFREIGEWDKVMPSLKAHHHSLMFLFDADRLEMAKPYLAETVTAFVPAN